MDDVARPSQKEIQENSRSRSALLHILRKRRKAHASFEAVTPGKRREYAEYVASAKREETRLKRVEKVLPMIEEGVGLNDRYRRGGPGRTRSS